MRGVLINPVKEREDGRFSSSFWFTRHAVFDCLFHFHTVGNWHHPYVGFNFWLTTTKGQETMKKDKPVFAFTRQGNYLIPDMEMDLAALEGVQQGQKVIVDIKHGRNTGRHRAYWLTLHKCIEATGCAPTVSALHSTVKLETGLVDHVRLSNGMTVAVPSSTAFEKLSEDDFIKYFTAAEQWLAQEYGFVMPDRTEPQIKAEAEEKAA